MTTAGEYAPVWVQQRPTAPAGEPLTFVAGQGRVVSSQLSVATGNSLWKPSPRAGCA